MATNPITTPLPADLPTDWQANQIISPDGTSAGLAEQYGYNYLMEAVNAAQTGVNALGNAIENTGGFIEMDTAIPADERNPFTLYGLILANYGGGE